LVTIEDEDPPLDPGTGRKAWALWNLILTIAGVLLALLMGLRILLKKRERDEEYKRNETYARDDDDSRERRGRLILILALPILAFIAIILFILTQDIRLPMVLADRWTFTHLIIFVCSLLCYIFAYRRNKDEEDDDEYPSEEAYTRT